MGQKERDFCIYLEVQWDKKVPFYEHEAELGFMSIKGHLNILYKKRVRAGRCKAC